MRWASERVERSMTRRWWEKRDLSEVLNWVKVSGKNRTTAVRAGWCKSENLLSSLSAASLLNSAFFATSWRSNDLCARSRLVEFLASPRAKYYHQVN